MLLIGSTAIKYHFPDFKREPNDIDIVPICHNSEYVKKIGKYKIEYLLNPVLRKYQKSGILSADGMLTLKCSHIFWNIKFDKHMWDIQFLISKGCVVNYDLFHDLYRFWEGYHGKNHRSDLGKEHKVFFGDNSLNLKYEHDYIHTLLADVPAYTKILDHRHGVSVSKEKFNFLSYEDKLKVVTEEVMVMAWERYYKLPYRSAYSKMLKKFLQYHAPMWETMFIIENWITLTKCPYNYFKLINNKLEV